MYSESPGQIYICLISLPSNMTTGKHESSSNLILKLPSAFKWAVSDHNGSKISLTVKDTISLFGLIIFPLRTTVFVSSTIGWHAIAMNIKAIEVDGKVYINGQSLIGEMMEATYHLMAPLSGLHGNCAKKFHDHMKHLIACSNVQVRISTSTKPSEITIDNIKYEG